MRIAALFLGLIAGLFALLAPSALRTDLMSPFLELWASNPSEHLLGTIIWYAIPAAALLGGLLASVTPGFAALLLFGAACGWAGIGLMVPALLNFQLLAPAAAATLASVLAFLAGELEIRQRRMRRRSRQATVETLIDDGEIEREAALRIDPLVVPHNDLPPPPKRPIPLTLDDVSVTSRPAGAPPRWQDLDAPSDRRRGPDMWAEAIRDEPEPEAEPVVQVEPEPFPKRGSTTTRREFKWDDDDVPAGQRREPGPAAAPRLEPRRAEPPPRPAAPPPPPAPPSPPQQPEPAQAAVAGESWPEPRIRRPIPVIRDEPPRRSGLVAALAAIVAVLVLAVVGVGGYFAYREGWVDQLIAMARPTPSTEAPRVVASTPEPAKVELPTQPASIAPPQAAATVPPPAGSAPATSAAVQPATTAAAATPEKTFDDPFAYCRAVGTVDYIDERYAGPAMVEVITRALSLPVNASRDRVHWRCVRGALLACTSYAGPICDMAPTVEEMRAFCQRNPTVKQLLAPSGTWSCVDGHPQLPEGATWPVDERGFLPLGWIVVRPDATPTG